MATVGEYETEEKGALTYLVDDEGRVVSEGYHKIRARKKRAGPPENYEYLGTRGASEHRISPIPKAFRGGE